MATVRTPAFSGLPQYEINLATGRVMRRGYALYVGLRGSREEVGRWREVGYLSPSEIPGAVRVRDMERVGVRSGTLVPDLQADGTPVLRWVEPGDDPVVVRAAQAEWLARDDAQRRARQALDAIAASMEADATAVASENHGLAYRIRTAAADIRGPIGRRALELAAKELAEWGYTVPPEWLQPDPVE